jgi:hypothetical protein
MRVLSTVAVGVVVLASAATVDAAPPARRHKIEVYIGIGFGNAVCDSNKPANECPVDPGVGPAFALGGAWRFHPHFAVGAEAGGWGFKTRESWRGNLQDPATKVNFTAAYFAPFARWYWFKRGRVDPYLQAGVGYGSVGAIAENSGGKYDGRYNGVAVHAGIGVDWWLGDMGRLGTSGMLYLHRTAQVCETLNGTKTCRDAGKDEALLAWRILVLQFTLAFG